MQGPGPARQRSSEQRFSRWAGRSVAVSNERLLHACLSVGRSVGRSVAEPDIASSHTTLACLPDRSIEENGGLRLAMMT